MEPEQRVAIDGIVKFPDGNPVKNAIVKLYRKSCNNSNQLIPVTFAFTDDRGQFLFGVDSKQNYCVKVFYYEPENKCVN